MKLLLPLFAVSYAQTTVGGDVVGYDYDDSSYNYYGDDGGLTERRKTPAEREEARKKAKAEKVAAAAAKYALTTDEPITTAGPVYTTAPTTISETTPYVTDPVTEAILYTVAEETAAPKNPYAPDGGKYGGDIEELLADNGGNNYGPSGPGTTQAPAPAISCFTCHGQTVEECQASGTIVACLENEESCELEVRTRYNTELAEYQQVGVITGCKQKLACQNNQKQNFIGNKDHTQCRPEIDQGYDHSVCRQCCWEDDCVDNNGNFWDPQTRWQWGQDNGRYGI